MILFDTFSQRRPELALSGRRQDFLVAVSTVCQRAFEWGKSELVLVPFLDMVNHRTNSTNTYVYALSSSLPVRESAGHIVEKPAATGWRLQVGEDHTIGEEVLDTYGNGRSSVQMLLDYGFLEADNPADYVILETPLGVRAVIFNYDFALPTQFAVAVNQALVGSPRVTGSTYTRVAEGVRRSLSEFSTSLAADQAALARGGLDQVEAATLMYRIEAKKMLTGLIQALEHGARQLSQGQAPRAPARSGDPDHFVWPLRVIQIDTDTEQQQNLRVEL